MEKKKTKLIIEDNTIYEIDLECVKRKQKKQYNKKENYGKRIRDSAEKQGV